MLDYLPGHISIIFIVTTILTLWLFALAFRKSSKLTVRKNAVLIVCVLLVWLLVQSCLTLAGVYHSSPDALPPRIIVLGVLPALIAILLLFTSKRGRGVVDSLPLEALTYVHVIRIPVELVLYALFIFKAVPELMTFEGRNFDIVSGISAPLIAYFGITKKRMGRRGLLIWNFICLGLLFNIVVNAVLSAPSPFQQFAFDQPNIAILNFPFSWLPVFVVPVVLFCHLAVIRQLLSANTDYLS